MAGSGTDSSSAALAGGSSKMLAKLGLTHNPYVDRTAENSMLMSGAFYLHSDLQGFRPSETTYIFFGKRGSGKTTIRLMMMDRYRQHNKKLVEQGQGPVFVVNLCRPGHLDECLKVFMHNINAERENWDSQFAEAWTSNDLADCILSFAINDMMRHVVNGSNEGKMILEKLSKNPRAATQFLLLSHLYTREDSATLNALRAKLLPSKINTVAVVKAAVGVAAFAGVVAAAGVAVGSLTESSKSNSTQTGPKTAGVKKGLVGSLPKISPKELTYIAGGISAVIGGTYLQRNLRAKEKSRAQQLCSPIRIAEARVDLIEDLLHNLFSSDDTADRICGLHIGRSAQQKLELMDNLARACGFQCLTVFGDCFDEVGLLDPLLYPGALKVFAREVCKNEVLNQGRMHFFFPDARASLDLSTDRIVREARFDRHFVRDLSWSRFQLEDLAERRFMAAQMEASAGGKPKAKFQDLFEHVSKEDFSGAISKLATPRELMVFMTELMARVEAHSEDGKMVAAQDMEIAVNKALEQSV